MAEQGYIPRRPASVSSQSLHIYAETDKIMVPAPIMMPFKNQDEQPMSGTDYGMTTLDVEHGSMDNDMLTYNDFLRKGARNTDREFMTSAGLQQELYRGFSHISLVCFSSTIMCTWEGVLFSAGSSIQNGGPVGLVYGFVFCFIGSLLTTLSLAELASLAPISAGQYYWVWILCTEKAPYRKALSWMTGCLSFCGWQSTVASGIYLFNTILRGLLMLNEDEPADYNWNSIVAWGLIVLVIAGIINVFCARWLSRIEGFFFMIHVFGYFAILIPLLHLGPRSSTGFVFTQLSVSTGWESRPGAAWCVGLLGTVFPLLGMDGPIHMSEEVRDASKNVPRAMVSGIIINGVMGFSIILVWLYSFGDITASLMHESGYPFIYTFVNATRTPVMAEVMTAIIIALLLFANLSSAAAASRQTYTLARDRMIPGHRIFKSVWQPTSAPTAATILTIVISCCLSLIQLGSTAAYQSVVSLAVTGLFLSYTVPISLLLYRRLSRKHPIELGPWHLSHTTGVVCNIGAIFYTVWVVLWSLFPPDLPVHLHNFNWSPVVLVGTIILASVYYVLRARHIFNGPTRQINRNAALQPCPSNPQPPPRESSASRRSLIARELRWPRARPLTFHRRKLASSSALGNPYSIEEEPVSPRHARPSVAKGETQTSAVDATDAIAMQSVDGAKTRPAVFAQKPFMPELSEQ